MTPPATATPAFPTIFNWRPSKSRKLSLLSFIAASAALHAFCFYVFQIVYPPTAGPPAPPARVNIITPASEEGRVLLRWIEAEDPALSSTTQRSPTSSALLPPKAEYAPSYVNRRPAVKEIPLFEPDLRVPSSRPPAPVPVPQVITSAAVSPVATTVKFSAETELGAPVLPSLRFTASNKDAPEAATFRIAIGAHGDVRHCFVQASSGDSFLDEQARRYLLLVRFPSIENAKSQGKNDHVWAIATIEWGNDLVLPPSDSAEPRQP